VKSRQKPCGELTPSTPCPQYKSNRAPFALDIEDPKIGLLNTCRELGVSTVAYSPPGRGFLTGSIKSRDDIKGDYRALWPRFSEGNFEKNSALVEGIKEVAVRGNIALGQATLAFLLAQGIDIVPIPGTKRMKALGENRAALKVALSNEEIGDNRKAAENEVAAGDRYPEVYVSTSVPAPKFSLLINRP
jgi:aryl-alcohol dehydrogenase-like predicted oxidoreductase